MKGKELNWIFWVLKNKMPLASGLDCFFLIPGSSISCNKELVGFSVVLASVLQWAKLCADFLLNYSFSEEMQVLQEIAA